MARTDTLSNFLTDVADAIRTKTGGSDPIDAADFDTAILSISGGDTASIYLEGTLDGETFHEDFDSVADMKEFLSSCNGTSDDEPIGTLSGALKAVNSGDEDFTGGQEVFVRLNSITSLDLSEFDVSTCTTLSGLVSNCAALTTVDVSNFNTSACTDMSAMFAYNPALREIVGLDGFDTSNVADMMEMFAECNKLRYLDLSNFSLSFSISSMMMFDSMGSDWSESTEYYGSIIFNQSTFQAMPSDPSIHSNMYVYVPTDLVDTYKAATNWSSYAEHIFAYSGS